MITKLTPQQHELVASYQKKWNEIYLSTARIERTRIFNVLEEVFEACPEGPTMPEVIFFESPYSAFKAELRVLQIDFNGLNDDRIFNEVIYSLTLAGEGQTRTDLWFDLYSDLSSWLNKSEIVSLEVLEVLREALIDKAASKIYEQVWEVLWDWLRDRVWREFKGIPEAFEAYWAFANNFIDRDFEWANYAPLFDFFIHELDWQSFDPEQWNLYQTMCHECNYWFLPTPQHYIVCDRPTKILFDDQGRLHGANEPAIEYIDGFGLYATHGKVTSIFFPEG